MITKYEAILKATQESFRTRATVSFTWNKDVYEIRRDLTQRGVCARCYFVSREAGK